MSAEERRFDTLPRPPAPVHRWFAAVDDAGAPTGVSVVPLFPGERIPLKP